MARPYRRAPLDIARAIAAHVATSATDPSSPIASVDVAPPGFLNIRLSDAALAATAIRILRDPGTWGHVRAANPEHINVEFVSANPTGPLHIGNARGAFTGDLLCRVFAAAGHQVEREYYFNDFGSQVKNLGASVLAIREGCDIPEDGYRGDYVYDMAKELPASVLTEAEKSGEDFSWAIGRWASEQVRSGIEASLDHLGCHFDVWRSESTLHKDGWVAKAIDRLKAAGDVYEEDGALVFRSTRYGDDKDRVILRSTEDDAPTYFAADIGYLVEKFSRGYQRIVFIWGEDHHGYVARVKAAAQSLGFDRDHVQMILTAWVRFVRDGKEIAMSKRAGEFITLDELLGEIGVDAARWFFASRAASSGIDFDIELAKKQSNENPVYYVQYAHARIASILRKAEEAGMKAPAAGDPALGALLGGVLGRAADGARRWFGRSRRAAGTADRSPAGSGRGRRLGRRNARHHRLRHGTGDHVPRLLPRRPCRGRRRARPLGRSPGPDRRHENDPRQRPGSARDLRPRIDVAIGGRARPGATPRRRPPSDRRKLPTSGRIRASISSSEGAGRRRFGRRRRGRAATTRDAPGRLPARAW